MLPGPGFFLFWKKLKQPYQWGHPGCRDNFRRDTLQITNAEGVGLCLNPVSLSSILKEKESLADYPMNWLKDKKPTSFSVLEVPG